jgi:hypothetical protein
MTLESLATRFSFEGLEACGYSDFPISRDKQKRLFPSAEAVYALAKDMSTPTPTFVLFLIARQLVRKNH